MAAQAVARSHLADELRISLSEFSSRLEKSHFAQIETWSLEQRRTILAELQSMQRLEFLLSDLNRWLAQIPGPALNPGARIAIPQT